MGYNTRNDEIRDNITRMQRDCVGSAWVAEEAEGSRVATACAWRHDRFNYSKSRTAEVARIAAVAASKHFSSNLRAYSRMSAGC